MAIVSHSGGKLMADQSDVEIAIQSIVASAFYPNGTNEASSVGNICRVYRGAPSAHALGVDIAASILNISVTALSNIKNTTRYSRVWQTLESVPLSLLTTVGAEYVSFAGRCVLGQLVGIIINGAVYPYAVQTSDSPTTVASNMAELIRRAGWIVDYAGSTITIPGANSVNARVVAGAVSLQEIKRQLQEFQVALWCPNSQSRDEAAALIDQSLSTTKFIALSDGSYARITYAGCETSDRMSDATLFKRELRYLLEYPTTISELTPAMLFGINKFSANTEFVNTLNS